MSYLLRRVSDDVGKRSRSPDGIFEVALTTFSAGQKLKSDRFQGNCIAVPLFFWIQ